MKLDAAVLGCLRGICGATLLVVAGCGGATAETSEPVGGTSGQQAVVHTDTTTTQSSGGETTPVTGVEQAQLVSPNPPPPCGRG